MEGTDVAADGLADLTLSPLAQRALPEPPHQLLEAVTVDDAAKDRAHHLAAQDLDHRLRVERVVLQEAEVVRVTLPSGQSLVGSLGRYCRRRVLHGMPLL